ncbi:MULTISPECIES: SCO6880 family protein [Clavibacter]|uniref:Integral membrane protein n=2 Tax=Clavibacter TaxID=1573 RepID=A0A399NGU1_9MICO|nr:MULTISPECIES: SCO6880 family protein [Clavibacter]KDP92154.1 membrane protein [Clavibacter cf. michiganensis LMG 26808]RII93302.1 hypothetical protein DZF96_15610 [Clavibacter michiganensis]UKF24836.1 hypothetical protein KYT88_14135 [Clavibacter sp. A6099]
MSAIEGRATARTYGNWRKPRTRGVGGLGMFPTMFGFAGAVMVIIVATNKGLVAGVITAAVFAGVLAAVAVKDKHGESGMIRIMNRAGWLFARNRGAHLYRSGPLGFAEWGTAQLPGLAAGSRLTEWKDSYGRPFALIEVPSTNDFTVVLGAEPDGSALVDQEQVDIWVAEWGSWLEALADEPGLVAASVTLETAPDTGTRLASEVLGRIDDRGSAFSKSVLRKIVATYPAGAATIKAYVAITFAGAARTGAARRSPEEMGRELAYRLPGLTSGLSSTGAGAARPLTAQDLCEVVRIAYDPAAAILIDQANSAGQATELYWPEVGPTAHQAAWDSYRHDSALSVSWMMSQAPRGNVGESILSRLLAPHRHIARKRVTMLYRPIDPARAAAIVEADKRDAEFLVGSTKNPTGRSRKDVIAAFANESEESGGAGLVNFGMVVTATVQDPATIEDARAAVDSLSAQARIRLRVVHGSQDSAFAAGLPLGLVLPRHLAIPHDIRDQL